MVHVFTAEWPAPKVGQNRVNPSDPHQLIPVSEAERREEFLQKIGQDHPLMDLIMSCLKNNPQLRVPAMEIAGRMNDLVLRFPPSFQNRIDMLQRISTDEAERGQLQQVIDTKAAQIDDNKREISSMYYHIGTFIIIGVSSFQGVGLEVLVTIDNNSVVINSAN